MIELLMQNFKNGLVAAAKSFHKSTVYGTEQNDPEQ